MPEQVTVQLLMSQPLKDTVPLMLTKSAPGIDAPTTYARRVIAFDETLSLVCTMYRDAAQGVYAAKEASFSLLMTGPRSSSTRQLARATLDLSAYAKVEAVSEDMKLVLLHDGETLFFPKHAPPLHPPLPTRPHFSLKKTNPISCGGWRVVWGCVEGGVGGAWRMGLGNRYRLA